jgi:hypothetical protein
MKDNEPRQIKPAKPEKPSVQPPPQNITIHLTTASPSSPSPNTDAPGGQKFDSRKPQTATKAFKTKRRFGTGHTPPKF